MSDDDTLERKRFHEADELNFIPEDETTRNKRPTLANEELNGNSQNAQRFCLRSLVYTKEAGIIIGKGGKSISEIRDYSSSKVTVSEAVPTAIERVLTVVGSSDNVVKAYYMISKQLTEENDFAAQNNNGNHSNKKNSDGTTTLRFLIPNSKMGILIGKGGSKIKELQELSQVKLNASDKMLPQSTERILTLNGTPNQIQNALISIISTLRDLPERIVGLIHYKPLPAAQLSPFQLQDAYMFNGTGGFPLGHQPFHPSQQPFNSPRNQRRPYNNMSHPMPYPMYPNFMMIPGQPPFPHPQSFRYPPNSMVGGVQPVTPQPAPGNGFQNGNQVQHVYIPSDMVGCVIGKGGSAINEIRNQSGAYIKIEEGEGSSSSERLVTINGSPRANNLAIQLLHAKLEKEKNKVRR
jgi:polyribonucleotide nucleotidyltransferase